MSGSSHLADLMHCIHNVFRLDPRLLLPSLSPITRRSPSRSTPSLPLNPATASNLHTVRKLVGRILFRMQSTPRRFRSLGLGTEINVLSILVLFYLFPLGLGKSRIGLCDSRSAIDIYRALPKGFPEFASSNTSKSVSTYYEDLFMP